MEISVILVYYDLAYFCMISPSLKFLDYLTLSMIFLFFFTFPDSVTFLTRGVTKNSATSFFKELPEYKLNQCTMEISVILVYYDLAYFCMISPSLKFLDYLTLSMIFLFFFTFPDSVTFLTRGVTKNSATLSTGERLFLVVCLLQGPS